MCTCALLCGSDSWQQVCVLLCGSSGVQLTLVGVTGGKGEDVGEGDSQTLALGLPRHLTAEEEGEICMYVWGCVKRDRERGCTHIQYTHVCL